jgi:peptidoglycan hydrolase-like protein with peptidoglycan-binding domain
MSLAGVLAAAASQIGYYVKPGGRTKFGEWYGLPTGQWCAMFVSWCAEQGGAQAAIPKHAYTPSGVAWFKKQGRWHDGTSGIARGDVVYFDFPGAPDRVSHVALVESVNGDGSINTIEGNTSGPSGDQRNGGLCARKQRKSYIVGYGRPNYDAIDDDAAKGYLELGDEGEAVRVMQLALIAAGFPVGDAGADSDFGSDTEAALIAYQAAKGLEPDGIFGAQSQTSLYGAPSTPTPAPAPAPAPAPVDTTPRNADGSITIDQDGDEGDQTISRWQEVMGTPIDGVIDKVSTLIEADQRFLNSVVAASQIKDLTGKSQLKTDGIRGPKTDIVRQFWLRNAVNPIHQQNLIGHPLDFDGIWGRESTLVMQFALNHATTRSGQYGRV